MRMFLSVSGHSSELSIANHSSRSTVSQLTDVSPTLYQADLRITNHRRQIPPPSFTLLSFKTRIKWPLGWPQPQVFRGYFFNSCNFKATSKLYRATPMTKTDLIFPAFSSRFVDFAVQFFFRCKFSFNEERRSGLTVARFFPTNHKSLLRIATNEIASFWIDRSRQMAFFLAKAGQRLGKRPAFALC